MGFVIANMQGCRNLHKQYFFYEGGITPLKEATFAV